MMSTQRSDAQSFLSSSLSSIIYIWKQHWPLIVGIPLVFISYLVYKYVLRVRYFSKIRHYPGPPHGHWLLGQAPAVISSDPGMAQLAWHKKYGKMFRMAGVLPGQETMSFNSYTALKTILVDKPYEFPKPPFLRDLLGIAAGYGLLTLEGPDHQALRRFMNQAFSFKYLHEQFEQYYKPINSLVEILETKTKDEKGQPVKEGVEMEVTKLIDSTLMDIICLTAFGYECDSLHNPKQPLAHSYHKLVNLQDGKNMLAIFLLLMLPFGPQLLRWAVKQQWLGTLMNTLDKRYGSGGKHDLDNMEEPPKFYTTTSLFIDNLNNVNRISAELLETKLAEARQLKQASGGEFAMNVSGGKVDVLSLLVRASLDDSSNYKMNSDMLQAQMLTFLGAGHETTASGAAWAMWELACNKDIQEKLRKECQELILRNHNPGWQELNELKYLNAVVQETMRVRPPTPQTARVASKDCTVDGTFVPKGTQLMIPIRAVNFDESIWGEDARQFKPERWFNLSEKYSSVFSVLTFIAGSHHCIGRNMAIQELKAILCALISRFEFEPAQSEPREKSAITMKPDGGLRLRVKLLDTR